MRAVKLSDEELGPLLVGNNYWAMVDPDTPLESGEPSVVLARVLLPPSITTRQKALAALKAHLATVNAGPSIDQLIYSVKQEAARRIEEAMPMWMVARAMSGGAEIPESNKAAAAALRQRSGEIEAQIEAGKFKGDLYADATWAIPPAKKGK